LVDFHFFGIDVFLCLEAPQHLNDEDIEFLSEFERGKRRKEELQKEQDRLDTQKFKIAVARAETKQKSLESSLPGVPSIITKGSNQATSLKPQVIIRKVSTDPKTLGKKRTQSTSPTRDSKDSTAPVKKQKTASGLSLLAAYDDSDSD
jgi:hypothetical protein